MHVSVVVLRGMLAALQRNQLDGQAWLSAAGLDIGVVADLSAVVSHRSFQRLLLSAMDMLNDPGLALTMAGRTDGTLHVVSHLLAATRTLREAFQFVHGYAPVFAGGIKLELIEEGPLARFRVGFEGGAEVEAAERFGHELAIATAYHFARRHVPARHLYAVRFKHSPPASCARFEECFGMPVHFDQTVTELIFDREALDLPSPYGDLEALTLLRDAGDRIFGRFATAPRMSERVMMVLGQEPKFASLEFQEVATRLRMSSRTLRRRLKAEGSSLRNLVDDLRRHLALMELQNTDATIKEAAARLGYSEVSSFHRAFKRWTGETPYEYQQAQRDALTARAAAKGSERPRLVC